MEYVVVCVWKSLSCVWLFATPWTVARLLYPWNSLRQILEWVATPFSRESSKPRIEPRFPTLWADSLSAELQGKPKNSGMGSLSLLQWTFPTQELNQGLLHCRRILYQLSYEGSPPWPVEEGKVRERWIIKRILCALAGLEMGSYDKGCRSPLELENSPWLSVARK